MPRVDCRECGKALSTRTRAARYCSDACRSPAARRARAEGRRKYAADPEKRALQLAHLRRSAAARGARERGDKRPPRASRGVKSPKPSQGSAEPYPCALCGRYFAPHGGRGRRPVHCKRCRAKADKEIGRERALNCKECGTRFSTSNRAVRYCPKACSAAGRNRISRESGRRRMADPEKRAADLARTRARSAASRAGKKGAAGGRLSAQCAFGASIHPLIAHPDWRGRDTGGGGQRRTGAGPRGAKAI